MFASLLFSFFIGLPSTASAQTETEKPRRIAIRIGTRLEMIGDGAFSFNHDTRDITENRIQFDRIGAVAGVDIRILEPLHLLLNVHAGHLSIFYAGALTDNLTIIGTLTSPSFSVEAGVNASLLHRDYIDLAVIVGVEKSLAISSLSIDVANLYAPQGVFALEEYLRDRASLQYGWHSLHGEVRASVPLWEGWGARFGLGAQHMNGDLEIRTTEETNTLLAILGYAANEVEGRRSIAVTNVMLSMGMTWNILDNLTVGLDAGLGITLDAARSELTLVWSP
jgi:hypothetical protein